MDGEDIFGSVVSLLVGAILLVAILGYDPSFLIDIAPGIVLFGFGVAFTVAILRTVID